MKKLLSLLIALLLALSFTAVIAEEILCEDGIALTDELMVEYGLEYSSKGEVALYLHCFCELPLNYITKSEAQSLGWVSNKGNLWDVAPGCSIGGDRFGNYEGLLLDAKGRKWYECDIDFDGAYRNALRIIFSNDGLIYYTEDHYNTFELIYEGWFFEGDFYDPSQN